MQRKNSRFAEILESVWSGAATSRRDLASFLEVSKGTITTKVGNLIDSGYLVETGACEKELNEVGRTPERLTLNKDLFYAVGINHNVAETAITIVDAAHDELDRITTVLPVIDNHIETLDQIKLLVDKKLAELKLDKSKLLSIGVSVPGIVDWNKGVVHWSGTFPNANELRVKDYFSGAFDCPCEMLNISQLNAINEKYWGKAATVSNFCCIDEKLGMGIFVNNQLCEGWQRHAGEFGYMKIIENGNTAPDGRKGTIWANASFNSITKELNAMLENGEPLGISQYITPDMPLITHRMIIKAACNGDKLCSSMLAQNFELIGQGVLNIAYILNPEVIYLPDWTGNCPECTVDVVKNCMTHYGASNWQLKTRIESAQCGYEFMPLGITRYSVLRTLHNMKIMETEK